MAGADEVTFLPVRRDYLVETDVHGERGAISFPHDEAGLARAHETAERYVGSELLLAGAVRLVDGQVRPVTRRCRRVEVWERDGKKRKLRLLRVLSTDIARTPRSRLSALAN